MVEKALLCFERKLSGLMATSLLITINYKKMSTQ